MKVYHCKLEEVGNRQMISLDLNLRESIQSQTICLSKGWALPTRKPKKGFSPKQREYLETKFNDGVSGKKHWKPKDVATDMENLRVNGDFYFSSDELLKENQIRSFFGRMKQERERAAGTKKNVVRHMDTGNNILQNTSKKDDQDNIDLDLVVLEDVQDLEAAIEETTIIENLVLQAKRALEISAVSNS